MLAAVTAGIYLGWRAPEIASPETRLQGFALWEILAFLLNATLFILIGLQLPVIVDGLSGRPAGEVVGYAALVCAAVIAVRFALDLHRHRRHPGARPPALAARAARRAGASGSSAAGRGCAAPSRSPPRWRCRSRPTPARRSPAAT